MKKIAILGATGSIGENCLNIVEQCPMDFNVDALTTHQNVSKLVQLAKKFRPGMVAITHDHVSPEDIEWFQNAGIQVFVGDKALSSIVCNAEYHILVNSVVGAAGFIPTLQAIERGKDIALANKETLVVGGKIVMQAAKQNNVRILPVDSEHSAIFQCLVGETNTSIEELVLTASGGPFLNLAKQEFSKITVEQALKHPNWSMGQKITIDSATMMNKGLEVIEASWLFDIPTDKIKVLIHPQSIIHSMVAFVDGSYKAQLGQPDMRVPIQYALTYPERKPSSFPRLNFAEIQNLTFAGPDLDKFRALALAYETARVGGSAPAVMNAANEEAVKLFLHKKIKFNQITEFIQQTLEAHSVLSDPGADELIQADQWARSFLIAKCAGNS